MFQMEQFHVERGLDPWYVTGFAESSGSFTYSRSGEVITLYFALKVGATDLPILQGLQAFFGGAGRVYGIRSRSNTVENGSYFRVTRARDLALIVAHFDRYPLVGSKREAYSLWREMVSAKQRFRKPDVRRLSELALRLSGLRT